MKLLTDTYPAALQELLDAIEAPELDPGQERSDMQDKLKALTVEDLFAEPITDKELAKCCLSGLWLAFNYLDTSHDISQSLPSSSGSYWHGIMHRREPDYSNSGYWFRKVGDHPIFKQLPEAVADTVASASSDAQALAGNWDPYAFNDLCQANLKGGSEQALCKEMQLIEWQVLFDYCYKGATA